MLYTILLGIMLWSIILLLLSMVAPGRTVDGTLSPKSFKKPRRFQYLVYFWACWALIFPLPLLTSFVVESEEPVNKQAVAFIVTAILGLFLAYLFIHRKSEGPDEEEGM